MIDIDAYNFVQFDSSKKAFLKNYRTYLGNVSIAAVAINYTRQRIYQWRDDDPAFKQAIVDLWPDIVGIVEAKLAEHIAVGNLTSIIFWLKTQMREKWGDNLKLAGDKENPLISDKLYALCDRILNGEKRADGSDAGKTPPRLAA